MQSSIVVCTHSRDKDLVVLLDSLAPQLSDNHELIIVYQGSAPLQSQQAYQLYSENSYITFIQTPALGAGVARNIGAAHAAHDIILYTDDDCVVPNDWVHTMTNYLCQNPHIALVFCEVRPGPHDATKGFIAHYYCNERVLTSPYEVVFHRIMGAGVAINRKRFIGSSFFDPCFGPGSLIDSGEDLDIIYRLLISGQLVATTQTTHVTHNGFRTWEEGRTLSKRTWFALGTVLAKICRIRQRYMLIALYEFCFVAIGIPLKQLMKLQKVKGLRNIGYFIRGFWQSLNRPLDHKSMLLIHDHGYVLDDFATYIDVAPVYSAENHPRPQSKALSYK